MFDAGELEKERGVVLEEIAMVEDTPEDLVHDLLSEAQYTGSLRRPILGTADLIRGYGRDALQGYWARHYTPENMVVAIAGNYDWDAFVSLVQRYFTPFAAARGDARAAQAQAFTPGRLAREKDTEQTHICLGFPGVPSDSDDLYALSVLGNALGGGMSSRLFQRIREELGLAYSVYTYSSSYQGLGSFCVYAGTTPDNAPTVLSELQSQLDLLLRDGLTDKEFRSAKAQLRGGFLLGLESSGGRMQALGRGHLLMGHVAHPGGRRFRASSRHPRRRDGAGAPPAGAKGERGHRGPGRGGAARPDRRRCFMVSMTTSLTAKGLSGQAQARARP